MIGNERGYVDLKAVHQASDGHPVFGVRAC
jgi:hypothetical protein